MGRSIIRKPSIKKSITARTKGRITRSVKRSIIPGYGKKGRGLITNPKKSIYNKVYNKTSYTWFDFIKLGFTGKIKD